MVKNYSGDGTVSCIDHWLDFEETRPCSCPKIVGICGWKNGHFVFTSDIPNDGKEYNET